MVLFLVENVRDKNWLKDCWVRDFWMIEVVGGKKGSGREER